MTRASTADTAVRLSEAGQARLPNGSGDGVIYAITPGWGSSGYYSKEVLEAAGKAKVFPAGLKMYLNHPSQNEEWDRPERDVRDVAGILAEDAYWDPNADGGGALVAPIHVFSQYRGDLAEKRDAIGVSIRAAGKSELGTAEGRSGQIITELSEGISIDFVTDAGRGGRLVALAESQRTPLCEVAGMTANQSYRALEAAIKEAYGAEETWLWIRDYADDWVVFQQETNDSSTLYRQPFEAADGVITLTGQPEEVEARTEYVPVAKPASESATTTATTESSDAPTASDKGGTPPRDHTGKEPQVSGPQGAPPSGDQNTTNQAVPADVSEAQARVEDLQRQLEEAQTRLQERSDHAIMRARAEETLATTTGELNQLRAAEHARTQTAQALAESGLPEAAFARVTAAVVGHEGRNVPLTEAGKVDGDKLTASITAAIDAERAYIASLAEADGTGVPRGLGAKPGTPADLTEDVFESRLANILESTGLDKDRAAIAAKGR